MITTQLAKKGQKWSKGKKRGKSSTESNVTRIAKFIGIKDFNAAEVAEKSSFKKASKQKITKGLMG